MNPTLTKLIWHIGFELVKCSRDRAEGLKIRGIWDKPPLYVWLKAATH